MNRSVRIFLWLLIAAILGLVALAVDGQEPSGIPEAPKPQVHWVLPQDQTLQNQMIQPQRQPGPPAIEPQPPSSIRKASRTLDARFLLLNSLHLELMILDVAMTQHCINDHRCREGNPLAPASLGGQLGVGFAFVGSGAAGSYFLKKRHSRFWWIAPVSGTAGHSVGLISGLKR